MGLAWKAALYPSGMGAIFTIEASLVRTPLWPMWVYMGPGLLLGLMGHDGGTKVVGFFLLRPLALLSGLRFLSILSIPGARQFINATTGGENILIEMS